MLPSQLSKNQRKILKLKPRKLRRKLKQLQMQKNKNSKRKKLRPKDNKKRLLLRRLRRKLRE